MTVACGYSANFVQLFLARMGVGIGEATLGPVSQSLIADLFRARELPLAMSIYGLGAIPFS